MSVVMLPRCRLLLSGFIKSESWLEASQVHFRRFRSNDSRQQPRNSYHSPKTFSGNQRGSFKHGGRSNPQYVTKQKKGHILDGFSVRDANDTLLVMEKQVHKWADLPHVHRRLESFGVPRTDVQPILSIFAREVSSGLLHNPVKQKKYHVERFVLTAKELNQGLRLDQNLTQLFYSWASDPEQQEVLLKSVSQHTLEQISYLYSTADMSYPADMYPKARSMRRKVIMHVGPTNSGKTHMALRALAAAKTGVYSGPLRLLAHEIWDRLNKGQIVPLGMDPDPDSEPDTSTNMDIIEESVSRPTVRKEGKAKYARECNLRTGEEFRIVSEYAGLVSCTVEMTSLSLPVEVAVVDEIQMLADPDRGSAWTAAVLGLPAEELHLCGEEVAVPIVQALLHDTDDELFINRYERLTPLTVQDESLEGDFGRVRKGDCLVAFSRSSIFALKRKVEENTGLRCAVAYGRLPPEIRAEQAALFNNPHSGYDVMIGSDAIGMGLNLKIKRIIFETLRKFDGTVERALSVSQIKQIAGRAGRYGLHGEPGGFVTTLHADDLPMLHSAILRQPDPIVFAGVSPTLAWAESVLQALPAGALHQTLLEVAPYVSNVRPPCRAFVPSKIEERSQFIETHAKHMKLYDRLLIGGSPMNWRDALAVEFTARLCQIYNEKIRVPILHALRVGPYIEALENVEGMMSGGKSSAGAPSQGLVTLEGLHKSLVLYLWLSHRLPVAFYQSEEAYALKERTEKALDWCLRNVSTKVADRQPASFGLRVSSEAEDGVEYRRIPATRPQEESNRELGVRYAKLLNSERRSARSQR
ncbi:P-loop containing nucleoside triphosphate hydrolase protein [Suillus plorans]|uniref:P-loop containing nucleoside triphosphate hydrolase protein n=1 Tax=Suillus plorans TaxID=116603 RepID=A0A9P7DNY2_9AGAM|nr:P-loop containing nucleoside triphosphate hydrolase protein [Suillus plorans]KAG1799374.1 P-loop containing nucleoside triphosphate hydrolase protein [Suillus plorans]